MKFTFFYVVICALILNANCYVIQSIKKLTVYQYSEKSYYFQNSHLKPVKYDERNKLMMSNNYHNNKSFKEKFLSKFMNLFVAFMISFGFSNSVWAAGKGNSKVLETQDNKKLRSNVKSKTGSKLSTNSIMTNKQGKESKVSPDKKKKVQVEIVLDKKNSKETSTTTNVQKFNKIGIIITFVTIVATLLFSKDDTNNIKNNKRVKPKFDGNLIDVAMKSRPTSVEPKKSKFGENLKKSHESLLKLPEIEELFKDESAEEIVDKGYNAIKENLKVENLLKTSNAEIVSRKATKDDQDNNDDVDETIRFPSAKPIVAPAPTPKPGFFDRIFKKAGGNRPINVLDGLRNENDASYSFRMTVLDCLLNYLPSEKIFDWDLIQPGKVLSYDESITLIQAAKNSSDLPLQELADSFADVTNALLVTIIDKAVDTLDLKNDNITLATLDIIADFIGSAGGLFGSTLAEAKIEPVLYNGKAKKGKLESLYYLYCKESLSLKNMLASAGLTGGSTDDSDNNDEAINRELKLEKLGRLQQVFSIKENKRNQIEQNVLKEAMMNVASGDGFGDLGNLAESLLGSGDNSANIAEMMKSMGMPGGMPGKCLHDLFTI